MKSPILQNEKCSREKIAAYLDGELEAREESILENHLANCHCCLEELNLQKKMFSALDTVFDDKTEITLPENFAKVVAIRAETNVEGLRSKTERFRALFFCAALFFLVLVGGGMWDFFGSVNESGGQIGAVLSFAGHLVYDFLIGLTIILRSVGSQPNINSAIVLLFLAGVFILPAIVLSRYFDNSNRF